MPSGAPQGKSWQQAGLGAIPLVVELGPGTPKAAASGEVRQETQWAPESPPPTAQLCRTPWAPRLGPHSPSTQVGTAGRQSPGRLLLWTGGSGGRDDAHPVLAPSPARGHTCPPPPVFGVGESRGGQADGMTTGSALHPIRSCLRGSQINLPAPAGPALRPGEKGPPSTL